MSALLAARSLYVRVGARPILDDVSIEIRPGELWALIGPNGSGKTLLLHTLLGARAAAAGVVELCGSSVHAMEPKARARLMTLVLQDAPFDFPLTVRELVGLSQIPREPARTCRAVDGALACAGLSHLADRPLWSLSGGERQRAHFARAMAQGCPLLLLDEPTAHMDLLRQAELFVQARAHVDRGGAALVATHDLSLVSRFATSVLAIAGGRVRAKGAARDVLHEATLEAVFGVRARVYRDERGDIEAILLRSDAQKVETCP